jgi:hypothetical protein
MGRSGGNGGSFGGGSSAPRSIQGEKRSFAADLEDDIPF